jgi:hypothetical protein
MSQLQPTRAFDALYGAPPPRFLHLVPRVKHGPDVHALRVEPTSHRVPRPNRIDNQSQRTSD